jgi:hypothetical protein
VLGSASIYISIMYVRKLLYQQTRQTQDSSQHTFRIRIAIDASHQLVWEWRSEKKILGILNSGTGGYFVLFIQIRK